MRADRTFVVIAFLAIALGIFSARIIAAQPLDSRVAQQNNQTTPSTGTEVTPPSSGVTTPPETTTPPPTYVPTPGETVTPPPTTPETPAPTTTPETPAPTVTPETPTPTTTPEVPVPTATPTEPSTITPVPSDSMEQPGGLGGASESAPLSNVSVSELPTTGANLTPLMMLGMGLVATGTAFYRKKA